MPVISGRKTQGTECPVRGRRPEDTAGMGKNETAKPGKDLPQQSRRGDFVTVIAFGAGF